MSEAEQLKEQPTAPAVPKDPSIFSDEPKIIDEPVTGPQAALATEQPRPLKKAATVKFFENASSFFFKFFLVGLVSFAAGITVTVLVMMDMIDHKSGWLKEFLQFIKEVAKMVIK